MAGLDSRRWAPFVGNLEEVRGVAGPAAGVEPGARSVGGGCHTPPRRRRAALLRVDKRSFSSPPPRGGLAITVETLNCRMNETFLTADNIRDYKIGKLSLTKFSFF